MQNELLNTMTYKLLQEKGSAYSAVFEACTSERSLFSLDIDDISELEGYAAENGHEIRIMGEFDTDPMAVRNLVNTMLKGADDRNCLLLAKGCADLQTCTDIMKNGLPDDLKGSVSFGIMAEDDKKTISLVLVVY